MDLLVHVLECFERTFLKMELLGHKIYTLPISLNTIRLFSEMLVLIYTPTRKYESFCFVTFSLTLDIVVFKNF